MAELGREPGEIPGLVTPSVTVATHVGVIVFPGGVVEVLSPSSPPPLFYRRNPKSLDRAAAAPWASSPYEGATLGESGFGLPLVPVVGDVVPAMVLAPSRLVQVSCISIWVMFACSLHSFMGGGVGARVRGQRGEGSSLPFGAMC